MQGAESITGLAPVMLSTTCFSLLIISAILILMRMGSATIENACVLEYIAFPEQVSRNELRRGRDTSGPYEVRGVCIVTGIFQASE